MVPTRMHPPHTAGKQNPQPPSAHRPCPRGAARRRSNAPRQQAAEQTENILSPPSSCQKPDKQIP